MNNQILSTIKDRLDNIQLSNSLISTDIKRNIAKEILQYYVLNFIYHHCEYRDWIMYGGSALRICHGLDRMSVDLDFEISNEINNTFLLKLEKELKEYFYSNYNISDDLLTFSTTNNRGLTLKFHIADILDINSSSKQIHVKIDLNNFVAPKSVRTEYFVQNKYQLSFAIKTYNMPALMASKVAALFLRGKRGVGPNIYNEKGRDIYDLLWYMQKEIIPKNDYLRAKNVKEAKDLEILFNELTIKMKKVSDDNLKEDLKPLFINQEYIKNWIENWRISYDNYLANYKIKKIKDFLEIYISKDRVNNFYLLDFTYKTENNEEIDILYRLSEVWIKSKDGDIDIKVSDKLLKSIRYYEEKIKKQDKDNRLERYCELFLRKNKDYLKKNNNMIISDRFDTKIINNPKSDINQGEGISLNKLNLLKIELDDLLK
ncbi:nucleotidyl transferase AbiEii/AbiGii toxin family protein [Patescibacteria group bacterium]|nr:nucleotidyl transferase AbiEii/AbiGii toxin family protein [Patescibacteria group bacterium]